jgi:hypothetical protein
MALKCAICGRDKNVDVVCHHCGKPLCDDGQCRFLIPDDPVFTQALRFWQRVKKFGNWLTGKPAKPSMVAFHCPACKQQFHKRQRTVANDQWVKQPAPDN